MVVYFYGDLPTFAFLQKLGTHSIRNVVHEYSVLGPGLQPWIVQVQFLSEYLENRWSEVDSDAEYLPLTVWVPDDCVVSNTHILRTLEVFMPNSYLGQFIARQLAGEAFIIQNTLRCHWFTQLVLVLGSPAVKDYIKGNEYLLCRSDKDLCGQMLTQFPYTVWNKLPVHLNGCSHCREAIAPTVRALYRSLSP